MKKTFKFVLSLFVILLLTLGGLGCGQQQTRSRDFLMSSQIFNQIFDAENKSARISMNVDSMKDSTALTDAVTYPVTITHETSGTPAANIGVGVKFKQQTGSSGNNEILGTIESIATIVTGDAEYGAMVIKTMANGAAAAKRIQIDNTAVALETTLDFKTCTIAADDVTPDVAGCQILTTSANTGATAITDLDNPVVGSVIYLIGGSDTNSSTIADSGNFALSAAWTAAADDILILFVQADNDYIELGRVDN